MELVLQLLLYGLSNGAVLALNAIGVTVVYGTVRTLNLAHGDVFALSTVLVITLITQLRAQPTWSPAALIFTLAGVLLAAMIFGALLNVAIERAAFKPFRGRSKLAPLIATLGISFILYQAALTWRTLLPSWVKFDHRSVPGLPEVPLEDRIPELLPNLDLVQAMHLPLHVTFRFSDLFILLIALIFAIGVSEFLRRTWVGRAIRAVAQNVELSQLCGINPDTAITQAFAFSGALAGIAAFIFAIYYTRPFGNHGAQSGLLAFTAAIIGGIGSPWGALLSSVSLGIATAFSDYLIAAQWTPVLMQVLLIGLMILRPTGLATGVQGDEQLAAHDTVTATVAAQRGSLNTRLLGALIVLAIIFPIIDNALNLRWQILLTGVGVFILLALGLNILLGVAGILDLGYAVSFGLGGYTAALLPQPLDFIIVAILSALVAGFFGALKGRLTLRLRSDYLAVVTLALGLLARQVANNLSRFTGGAGGIAALPPPYFFNYPLTNSTAQYYLTLTIVIAAAILSYQMIRSRAGRAWLASSEDETAAAASGLPVVNYKTLALTLSSALAGLAGALYATLFAYVSPDMVDFHISAMMLAMVILGGAGSVPGAIMGALIIAGYDRLLIPRLGEVLAQLRFNNFALDIRETSYFNFGLALYLTVFWRGRKKKTE